MLTRKIMPGRIAIQEALVPNLCGADIALRLRVDGQVQQLVKRPRLDPH